MDNAAEKIERRKTAVHPFNVAEANIHAQYSSDKKALEEAYLEELRQNRLDKAQALVDAGLNPDGSDPQGRPQGLAE